MLRRGYVIKIELRIPQRNGRVDSLKALKRPESRIHEFAFTEEERPSPWTKKLSPAVHFLD